MENTTAHHATLKEQRTESRKLEARIEAALAGVHEDG
jgi:hypothetical protein